MGFKRKRSVTEPTLEVQADQIEEALDLPLDDASGIQYVAQRFGRSARDADEDELLRFPDPSLVVRSQSDGKREELTPLRADDSGEVSVEFFGEPVGARVTADREARAADTEGGLFDVADADSSRREPPPDEPR